MYLRSYLGDEERIDFAVWQVSTLNVDEVSDGKFRHAASFTPSDCNDLQSFDVQETPPAGSIKLLFPASTDLFGRIVIYRLDMLAAQQSQP